MISNTRPVLKIVGLGLLFYMAALIAFHVVGVFSMAVIWQDHLEHGEDIGSGVGWVSVLIWVPAPLVGGFVSARMAERRHTIYGFTTGFLGTLGVIFLTEFETSILNTQLYPLQFIWTLLGGLLGVVGAMAGSRKKSGGHS